MDLFTERSIRIVAAKALLLTSLMFGACAGDDEVHVEPSRESLSSPGGNVVDLEPTPFGSPTREGGFWNRALMSGMANVEFSRIALDKIQDREIRQFAQTAITEHTKINEQLRSLAPRENVSLPSDLDPEHRVMKQKMLGVSGDEFDRVYVDVMLRAHEDAVELYEHQAETATRAEAKSFAERTLPIIREHLKRIRLINANMT